MGSVNGGGFGWDDTTTYNVGVEWGAGYSHGDQPIPDSEVLFYILAPAVIDDHVSVGFTRAVGQSSKFSLAGMFTLDNEVTGTNPFDPTPTITIGMHQWEVELSYSWHSQK